MDKFHFYINIFFSFIIFFFVIIDLGLYFNPLDQLFYYLFIIFFIYLVILIILGKFIYIYFLIILLFCCYLKFFYNLNYISEAKIKNPNILRIATFNLNIYNDSFNSKVFFKNQKQLREIYCFQEVSKHNYNKIISELFDYYTSHNINEINKWSSIIFSKYKLMNTKIYNNHTFSYIEIKDFKFVIVCTHFNIFERNTIDILNKILQKIDFQNILFLGDLNSVPYSFHFKKLVKLLKLKSFYNLLDSPRTWPSALPNIFRIQIDNVLIGGNFNFSNFFIGKNYKSDHLPLFVDLEY